MNTNECNSFRQLLNEEVDEAIHPTEVFDMIVGTSTGAIVAMMLLAGKEVRGGRREGVTLAQCIAVYEQ